nr:HIT domain-containing protein [Litorihabitans aurantiacus]
MWTPHRMVYIDGADKPTGDGEHECPFCRVPHRSDSDGLVVARGETAYVVLNLYPYNPGHLMVVPYRHVALYPDLTTAEVAEIGALTQGAMRVLRATSGPAGFNLGINQGEVGGAGIAAHLHQHVVPRWRGDANFMPIVAGTKPLPQLLGATRETLAAAWVERSGTAARATTAEATDPTGLTDPTPAAPTDPEA